MRHVDDDHDDQEPRPVSSLVPLCDGHLRTGKSARECVVCRLDRFERTLTTIADPMSTLTPRGVQQLAADALRAPT